MSTFRVVRRQRYTTIDRQAVNDERLSFRARGILVWLLDKPDDWRCSSDQIAAAGSEGRDAVRTALTELQATGYIVRRREQDPKTGQWAMFTDVHETSQTGDGFPGAGNPEPGNPASGNPASGEPGDYPKTVNEDCDQEETPLPPASGGSVAPLMIIDGRFDLFWEQWPKKTDRKAAQRAFQKAMKIADHEDVIAGLQPWLAFWEAKNEPQFIPYPATWLNKERWKDSPPARDVTPKLSKGAQSLINVVNRSRRAQ